MASIPLLSEVAVILLCLVWFSSCQDLRFDVSRKLPGENSSSLCVRLQCSSQRREKQLVLRYVSLSVLEQAEGESAATKLVSVFPLHEPILHRNHTTLQTVFAQGKVTRNRAELYVRKDAKGECESTTVYSCHLQFIDMQGKDQTVVAIKGQKIKKVENMLEDSWASETSASSGVMLDILHNLKDRMDVLERRLNTVESETNSQDEESMYLDFDRGKVLPRVPVISVFGFPVLHNNMYGGGWLVIQRRVSGNTDFYRGWNDYRNGFGQLHEDFWLGNEHIHQLTTRADYELRVELAFEGERRFAFYSHFRVSGADDNYRLNVSGYAGTAGDSLGRHNEEQFTTFDSDNDEHASANCAISYKGGWWYEKCHSSNLNGEWNSTVNNRGPRWGTFTGAKPASSTEMMIRLKLN